MNLKLPLLTLALTALLTLSGCWQTGDSEYVGIVTKVGHVGAIWPTYEIEIHLVDQKGTMVADSHHLSVDASAEHGEDVKSLVAALKDAQDKGTRVKLTVNSEAFVGDWRAGTNHFISKVELMP